MLKFLTVVLFSLISSCVAKSDESLEEEAQEDCDDGPGDDLIDLQKGLCRLHESADAILRLAEHFAHDDGAPTDAYGVGDATHSVWCDGRDIYFSYDTSVANLIKPSHLDELGIDIMDAVHDVRIDHREHGEQTNEDRHRT